MYCDKRTKLNIFSSRCDRGFEAPSCKNTHTEYESDMNIHLFADVGLKSFPKLASCVDDSHRGIRVPPCCEELFDCDRMSVEFL